MRILHGFNVAMYACNAAVWYFGAHQVTMAVASLIGVILACLIWRYGP